MESNPDLQTTYFYGNSTHYKRLFFPFDYFPDLKIFPPTCIKYIAVQIFSCQKFKLL